MMQEVPSTHRKALTVNLDRLRYGTLAEIGAGQEVASWLFKVGGAAGTVAKTISAYDMKFSDDIYGPARRYVSRERVASMLDHEYSLLLERLGEERGKESTFFVFADSVSARNYQGTNVCHGWLGMRFQTEPLGPPHDIRLHVNLGDETNLLQQQALGILGINLIHGAFKALDPLDGFLSGLRDDLSPQRIEVDTLASAGPDGGAADDVDMAIRILESGLSRSVLLTPQGELETAAEVFHRRPVMVIRMLPVFGQGSARSVELAQARFRSDVGSDQDPLAILELPLKELAGGGDPIRSRIDVALERGYPLLLTDLGDQSELTSVLQRHARAGISYLISTAGLVRVFCEKNFAKLPGGTAQAMARFISTRVKLYVAPMSRDDFVRALQGYEQEREGWEVPGSGTIGLESLRPRAPLLHLFRYLKELGALVGLDRASPGAA